MSLLTSYFRDSGLSRLKKPGITMESYGLTLSLLSLTYRVFIARKKLGFSHQQLLRVNLMVVVLHQPKNTYSISIFLSP